jgi:hypothetical protein
MRSAAASVSRMTCGRGRELGISVFPFLLGESMPA